MFVLVAMGAPFALSTLMAIAVGNSWRWPSVLLTLGLVLGVGAFVWAYLGAPPDYQHSQGDEDGEMFLGRWWEPGFVALIVAAGYMAWMVGVAFGCGIRALVFSEPGSQSEPGS